MSKQPVILQWNDDTFMPITREKAAMIIRGNRRRQRKEPSLQVQVVRKNQGETLISSSLLGICCCIAPYGVAATARRAI